jgi:hypothetical protein
MSKIEAEPTTKEESAYAIAGALRGHSNYTLGVLLTIVESALGDSVQAKAVKDNVRR